jgi:hypothetical protein
MEIPPWIKQHQLLVVGGVTAIVVFIAYEMLKGGSSSAGGVDPSIDPATGVPYSVETQQAALSSQSSTANAQIAAQSQAESDANNQATAQLNASINATTQQTEVQAVTALGSAISGIDSANAAIPVAAINAAAGQNQAALQAAAGVAANAVAAVPGVIQGAGSVLAAANAPSYALYGSLANSAGAQAVNSLGSNLATSEQASASVANSAANASASKTNSNNQLIGEVGTIAAIALL